jgi:threonine dehydratase
MISVTDIQQARRNIEKYIHRTPLIHSHSLSALSGAQVYLKLENLQKTGAFKVRGAINKIIGVNGDKVIAASMGNHAQAVAFAARMLGKKAKIVMPESVSLVKEEATRGYGAEVELFGEGFREALEHARSAKDNVFIHAFDDDDVISGQGTIGLEILEDLENPDAVLVPVGGGGLIAGTATAVKALSPRTSMMGVQTELAPAACVSFREKRIEERAPEPTVADGIAVNQPGERTFEIIRSLVDEMLEVSEDSIARAILLLLERKKIVVEGAGAAPLAALLEHGGPFRGKRVVLVLSGGNIDFALIDRIIRRGLVTTGRIGVVEVTLTDDPGSLWSVAGIMASHRANVLDVLHDRLGADIPFGKTRVIFTVEIRGKRHHDEILSALAEEGYSVKERGT